MLSITFWTGLSWTNKELSWAFVIYQESVATYASVNLGSRNQEDLYVACYFLSLSQTRKTSTSTYAQKFTGKCWGFPVCNSVIHFIESRMHCFRTKTGQLSLFLTAIASYVNFQSTGPWNFWSLTERKETKKLNQMKQYSIHQNNPPLLEIWRITSLSKRNKR